MLAVGNAPAKTLEGLAKCNHVGYPRTVPYRPFEDQNCSVAGALAIVGERWTLLVLREVLLGRRRFQEIKRNTGIATNILTDRLATLVEHGVLERRLYSEQPESYEYVATQKARDVTPILAGLLAWGDKHVNAECGAPRVQVHTACGHDAHPALVCTHCGERIEPGELKVRPGPGANARQLAEPLLPAAR
jgi:DNA-binding HxlR family transcriptional regulator